MDNLQTSPQVTNKLPLAELLQMDGFIGVNPNTIFGLDCEGNFDKLHPLAKSYAGVGSALNGQVLDFWVNHGMYRLSRAPHFSNFGSLTEGLSIDEKVRAVVILQQYLNDIAKGFQRFRGNMFYTETLSNAQEWVCDMLSGVDDETHVACVENNIPGFEPKIALSIEIVDNTPTESNSVVPTQLSIVEKFTKWMQKFIS